MGPRIEALQRVYGFVQLVGCEYGYRIPKGSFFDFLLEWFDAGFAQHKYTHSTLPFHSLRPAISFQGCTELARLIGFCLHLVWLTTLAHSHHLVLFTRRQLLFSMQRMNSLGTLAASGRALDMRQSKSSSRTS
jgi:hypothetical protein